VRTRRLAPLRRRLTIVVAAVLLGTLTLTGITTYLVFSTYLMERLDDTLRDGPIGPIGLDGPGRPDGLDGPDERASDRVRVGPDAPGQRGVPFIQVISDDGRVLRSQAGRDGLGHAFTPRLPAKLPLVAGSDVQGGPATFFNTPSREAGGPRLRVKVSVDRPGETLILALPRTGNERLLRRLALVQTCVAAGALLIASLTARFLVRRGLAPLSTLAESVESLTTDDLTRRVPVDTTTREVHNLASATNVLLERVDDAFAREQATQERLRAFTADASHELRTPVAAVSAYAQLFDLGAKDRPDDLARAMSGIQRESARMRDLVEELLTLAATQSPASTRTEPVALAGVLQEAVDASLAVGPAWPVTVTLEPGLGSVQAEPGQLRRVLDNLLANVRAHTPPGTQTQIEARRDGEQITVTIADNGPGLREDERAQMFDRFWRQDRSRSRRAGGSGLGLAIVAAYVMSWNGTVRAAPTHGGGLSVTISLRTAVAPPG
jgi:two-component system OmpR family sensor kinase